MEAHTRTPRWTHGKMIGKGSYGVVTLGVRVEDGQTLAVKSADKSCVSSVEALDNEINILSSLSSSSPFIVDYYGVEETTSSKHMFLEYLPAGDVARGGTVADVDLIRSYTWCLVTAVLGLHDNGIVHCDVKGGNVLLAGGGVAKLADFGSSKRAGGVGPVAPRGSPLWMAPEVVRGESQGYESDVWSIGCTVIEMFSGVPAWRDNGARTLYRIGYSGEVPEYPARVPDLGRDFLDKCLAREPGRRWRCDQLLQHPFLLPAAAAAPGAAAAGKVILGVSPRSVFDSYLDNDVDFEDEVDEDEDEGEEESDEVLARGRIGNLATVSGVNWESDGWVDVRNVREGAKEEEVEVGEEVIVRSTLGVISEFENVSDPTWIHLSMEIDDVENDGGIDNVTRYYNDFCDGRGMSDGEENIKDVIFINLLLIVLAIIFGMDEYYFSCIIGRVLNVNRLLLIEITTNSSFLFSLDKFLKNAMNYGDLR
ncbi:hypothetical protein vseg_004211 [Gypsophila vaccaria]